MRDKRPVDELSIEELERILAIKKREERQKRLSRMQREGRMVEADRYCIDVVTQISAVRAALRRAEEEILRDHVAHCVEHAIASGDKLDQRKKIAEIMDVLSRADR